MRENDSERRSQACARCGLPIDPAAKCSLCGVPLCPHDARVLDDETLCPRCYREATFQYRSKECDIPGLGGTP